MKRGVHLFFSSPHFHAEWLLEPAFNVLKEQNQADESVLFIIKNEREKWGTSDVHFYHDEKLYSLLSLFRLRKFLKKQQYNYIHLYSFRSAFFLFVLTLFLPVKLFLHPLPVEQSKLHKILFRLLIQHKRVEQVRVPPFYLASPKKVRTDRENQITLLYMGPILFDFLSSSLIEEIRRASEELSFKLLIVGIGEDEMFVRRAFREAGLEHMVEYRENLPSAATEPISLLLVPFKPLSFCFPLYFAEYMSVPLLVTDSIYSVVEDINLPILVYSDRSGERLSDQLIRFANMSIVERRKLVLELKEYLNKYYTL